MKAYNQFNDKYGNKYEFENYADFAMFWFNIPFSYAKMAFPDFKNLQKEASNSKEARTRIAI